MQVWVLQQTESNRYIVLGCESEALQMIIYFMYFVGVKHHLKGALIGVKEPLERSANGEIS